MRRENEEELIKFYQLSIRKEFINPESLYPLFKPLKKLMKNQG